MPSQTKNVEEYLAGLPEDRRAALQTIRQVILKNLPAGYAEGIQYGMIGYYVPHSVYPPGYHCDPRQPLPFAALGSQKNYMSLHFMPVYGDEELAAWLRQAWAKTGKKLDMGKACIRFKKVDDLALDIIGEALARVPVKKYVARCEAFVQSRAATKKQPARGPGRQPSKRASPAAGQRHRAADSGRSKTAATTKRSGQSRRVKP